MHHSFIPKMVKILDKLVKIGVQVILTTHNMITVNSFNEANVFYINKNESKVKKCNYTTASQILGDDLYFGFKKENITNTDVL